MPPFDAAESPIEKSLKESKALRTVAAKGQKLVGANEERKRHRQACPANSLKLEETGWFLRNAPQLPKVGELRELRSARDSTVGAETVRR